MEDIYLENLPNMHARPFTVPKMDLVPHPSASARSAYSAIIAIMFHCSTVHVPPRFPSRQEEPWEVGTHVSLHRSWPEAQRTEELKKLVQRGRLSQEADAGL